MVELQAKDILEILSISRDELKILTRHKNGHRIYTPSSFSVEAKVPLYNFGDLFSLCLIHNSRKSQYGNLLTSLVPGIQRSFNKVKVSENPFRVEHTGDLHWYFKANEQKGVRSWNVSTSNNKKLIGGFPGENFPSHLWFAEFSVDLTSTSQALQLKLAKALPEYKEQAGIFQNKKQLNYLSKSSVKLSEI